MTWTETAASTLIAAMGKTIAADDVALAAAVLDRDETAIRCHPGDLGADRRFEIGSVTKTMTATVLALLVAEGTLALDDPIGRWLAAGDSGATDAVNGAITLGQLATHTSGLPGIGPNVVRHGPGRDDPWAGYGFDEAEEGLRQVPPVTSGPWRYSNLGYQLLALVLQRAADRPFARLLAERVLEPLGMTASTVGAADDGLLLTGHGADGPVGPKAHPLGAGGVEAGIGDLARYARACLFPDATPLGAAIAVAQNPIVDVADGTRQALAWIVRDGGIREHSGGTPGFTACVSLDPGSGRAVVLLAASGGSLARASLLKRAAHLVLAGRDPLQADLPEPHPAWREHATAMAQALLAGDFAAAHAYLAPARRDKTTPERLRQAWTERASDAEISQGPDITIVRGETGGTGAVVVDLEIGFASRPQLVRLVILPDGMVGGLTFVTA